jgi:hypothetical protein
MFVSLQPCSVRLHSLARDVAAVTLQNDHIAVTVLADKGADIYSLVHVPSGLDVLWKSPQPVRKPGQGRLAADSTTAWLELYAGGWQEILPNGGDPCVYKGVELSFHGESTLLPWDYTVLSDGGDTASVEFTVRLARSPFHIRRRMTIKAGSPSLFLHETVTNWAGVPMDFMWGHHPAYGAPFLSDATRLYTSARTTIVDDSYDPPTNPYQPGAHAAWPFATLRDGAQADLSRLPGPSQKRDALIYLADFGADAWYALVNPALRLGVGMAWTSTVFRHAWLWQEVHANPGFPWYGQAYTVAVEPWSSYPGFGLNKVIETTRTQLSLQADQTLDSELTVTLFDVDTGDKPVNRVTLAGEVSWG